MKLTATADVVPAMTPARAPCDKPPRSGSVVGVGDTVGTMGGCPDSVGVTVAAGSATRFFLVEFRLSKRA